MRWLWRLAILSFACERDSTTPARSEPETDACYADQIGALRGTWNEPASCAEDPAGCRERCLSGDGDACFSLAIRGEDDSANKAASVELFRRACDLGLALGCTNWAAFHWTATGVVPTPCLYRVFEKSCNVDEPFGCSMMARILVEAPRFPADPFVGFAQLQRACDEHDGPPCRFLAYYLERGDFGPAPEADRIEGLLRRACAGGDEDACGKTTAADTMN